MALLEPNMGDSSCLKNMITRSQGSAVDDTGERQESCLPARAAGPRDWHGDAPEIYGDVWGVYCGALGICLWEPAD